MKKLIKYGCLVIVGLFVLMVGMCSYGLYKTKTTYEPEIRIKVNKVVEYYNAGDYDGLYEMFDESVKAQISKVRNNEMHQKYKELVGNIAIQDLQGVNYKNFNGTTTVSATYLYSGVKSSSFISFTYMNRDGDWKLIGYNMNIK